MVAFALGCLSTSSAEADPVLGLADDGGLIMAPVDPGGVLDAGAAHGASFVRMIAYMGSYPNDDRYVQAAARAAARGLDLDVVLALPWGQDQAGVTPEEFAAWAAQLATRLAALGSPLRVSLLNEPDLILSAGASCDPMTAERVVRATGYAPVAKRVRVVLRRSRIARRLIRRHGRHRVIRRKLVWKVRRWKKVKGRRLIETGTHSTITVGQGCLAIRRARRTAPFLNAAIPAVRAAVPGIEVGAGETSPNPGVEVFMRELARVGIPPIDRWAHHPHLVVSDRWESAPDGWMGPDRLVRYTGLVRELFGTGIPVDLTEFGVHRSVITDAHARAAIWRTTFAHACAARSRSIVAYQWTPTPAGQGRTWDTAILGDGHSPTPESEQLRTLRC